MISRFIILYICANVALACKSDSIANENHPTPKKTVSVPVEESMDSGQGNIDLEKEKEQIQEKEQIPLQREKTVVTPAAKTKSLPEIVFSETAFDFGRVVQGEKVLHEFTFVNKGREPIVVKDAKASCGCTQPLYPFVPIESGEKGTILVQFNSTGRLGKQSPTVEVFSNGNPSRVLLHLRGTVVTAEFDTESNSEG